MSAARLYGLPGADCMFSELADCYEVDIEPWVDGQHRHPWIIEEWTVHPPRHHLPTRDDLLVWIDEWACDMGEVGDGWPEHFGEVMDHPRVKEAAGQLLDAIASHITYRMADQLVRTITIMWDADGSPLADGARLYDR